MDLSLIKRPLRYVLRRVKRRQLALDRRLIDEDAVIHVSFVTDDVIASARWFAEITGKPMPQESRTMPPEQAKAVYRGAPVAVGCRIMTFEFGNVDIEFLEPGPEKSIWRELLEEKGPGCHHIAFRTRNMSRSQALLEGKGHELVQRGEFNGGRYAYYDTLPRIGALIELLENHKGREPQEAPAPGAVAPSSTDAATATPSPVSRLRRDLPSHTEGRREAE